MKYTNYYATKIEKRVSKKTGKPYYNVYVKIDEENFYCIYINECDFDIANMIYTKFNGGK